MRGAAAIPVGARAVTMGRRENPAFATRQMLHEPPNIAISPLPTVLTVP